MLPLQPLDCALYKAALNDMCDSFDLNTNSSPSTSPGPGCNYDHSRDRNHEHDFTTTICQLCMHPSPACPMGRNHEHDFTTTMTTAVLTRTCGVTPTPSSPPPLGLPAAATASENKATPTGRDMDSKHILDPTLTPMKAEVIHAIRPVVPPLSSRFQQGSGENLLPDQLEIELVTVRVRSY